MKKILITIPLIIYLFAFVQIVKAANEATVTATVTAQNVSVTVSDGLISYGILEMNSTKSTIAGDLNDQQTATNNGNVVEDLNIRGTDSDDWTLSTTADADEYVHRFCITSCATPPTNYSPLTLDYQTLEESVAALDTTVFDLQLNTPTSSSSFLSQSVDVVVQAVAD